MSAKLFFAFLVLAMPSAVLFAESLKERLQALSEQHQFEINGIEKITDQEALNVEGENLQRLLGGELANYNYILVPGPNDSVRRVRIISPKSLPDDLQQTFRIPTIRKDSHHLVDVSIMGNRPVRQSFKSLLDTGASTLVLPMSTMDALGYSKDDLEAKSLSTANGKVEGLIAILRQVEVGRAMLTDVEAAFVDDEKLGEHPLLGMSFLKYYEMTLSDSSNLLTLTRKPNDETED